VVKICLRFAVKVCLPSVSRRVLLKCCAALCKVRWHVQWELVVVLLSVALLRVLAGLLMP
jgi:hypothetical protein